MLGFYWNLMQGFWMNRSWISKILGFMRFMLDSHNKVQHQGENILSALLQPKMLYVTTMIADVFLRQEQKQSRGRCAKLLN